MSASLILYGSKARGDARADSDVDLILAIDGDGIGSPHEINGVSLHRYSKGWLSAQARSGDLFAYHVAFEGVALEDGDEFLDALRQAFQRKQSYAAEARVAGLILRLLGESDWRDNFDARRRYFWAMRTVLVCTSADAGSPCFSSTALESMSQLGGLAELIDRRKEAGYLECVAMGERILRGFNPLLDPSLSGERLREALMQMGGIARDSVRVVEEREAVEIGGMAVYL